MSALTDDIQHFMDTHFLDGDSLKLMNKIKSRVNEIEEERDSLLEYHALVLHASEAIDVSRSALERLRKAREALR